MFTPGSVSLLREVYNWTLADMDIHDLDEKKYNLCKKLSEVTNQNPLPCLRLTWTVGQ
jgi:exportin-5